MHFLLISLLFCGGQAANILGIFMYPSYSHQTIYQKICKELSRRGHHVTTITTNPLGDPSLTNLTEIDVGFVYNTFDSRTTFSKNLDKRTVFQNIFTTIYDITELQLNNSVVQDFIWNNNKKFDLVLRDYLNPTTLAFGFKFQAPVIDISPDEVFSFGNDRVGNPNHPVLYPEPILDMKPAKLSMWEKLSSIYFFVWHKLYYYYIVLPHFQKQANRYFERVPDLGEMERNVSMLFLYRNLLLHPPRANVPASVEIAPLDKKPMEDLPKDLEKILHNTITNVIYVNCGALTQEMLNVFLQAFSGLDYLILWASDPIPEKSPHIIVRKWFPQRKILAHPNVKAFISHGSLQSIEDALYSKIPMISIAFEANQVRNSRRIAELGIGEQLDFNSLTVKNLQQTIIKVVNTKKYRNKVQKTSKIFYDTPLTGIDRVIFWSEYVIRHKGAKHLRSAAVDMHFYEYLLLDVIFILIVSVLLVFYSIYALCAFITNVCCKKITNKMKSN